MDKSNFVNKKMLLLITALFAVGLIGLMIFGMQATGYIFAHIGALGFLGFYGVGAAYYANKKGYSDVLAVNLGFSLAILAGLVESALFFLLDEGNQFVCGGAASVIAGLIVLIIYAFINAKPEVEPES